MRKIIITDIDGTLIHNDERDIENIKAFKRLKERNHIAIACTGRSVEGVGYVEKDHNIKFDYYIVLNGAMILDADRNIIDNKKIPSMIAYEIISMIKADVLNISMNNGEAYFLVHGDGENLTKKGDGFKVETMDLEKVKEENVSSLAIHYKRLNEDYTTYLEEVCNKVNSEYGDIVIAYRNNRFIDIVPKGCSKGEGVKYIEKLFKTTPKEIYTIGDSGNDISMLEGQENSFTFSYAEDQIKEYANHVIDNFSECIDNYILK